MNNFVFQNPVKVYFGKGQIDNLSAELSNYGKMCCWFTAAVL